MTSEDARWMLVRLRRQIGGLERCGDWLSVEQRRRLAELRIHRNRLQGLLVARAAERRKPVVRLDVWRHGFPLFGTGPVGYGASGRRSSGHADESAPRSQRT